MTDSTHHGTARGRVLAAVAVASLALAGCSAQAGRAPDDGDEAQVAGPGAAAPRRTLGLLSSLPLYWPEGGAFASLGGGEANGAMHAHTDTHGAATRWARAYLERRYTLTPVDALTPQALARLDTLLLAQPRALSGPENVALDDWVRGGGRVLVFADPMLAGHGAFGLGDPRRPLDTALLDPILARWGLTLAAPRTDGGLAEVEWAGARLPVALPGRFTLRDPAGGAPAACTLAAAGLIARCRIGDGHALLVADATLLEADFAKGTDPEALGRLLTRLESDGETGTGAPRDSAGNPVRADAGGHGK